MSYEALIIHQQSACWWSTPNSRGETKWYFAVITGTIAYTHHDMNPPRWHKVFKEANWSTSGYNSTCNPQNASQHTGGSTCIQTRYFRVWNNITPFNWQRDEDLTSLKRLLSDLGLGKVLELTQSQQIYNGYIFQTMWVYTSSSFFSEEKKKSEERQLSEELSVLMAPPHPLFFFTLPLLLLT